MHDLPSLNESQVRRYVGDRSFSLGRDYVSDGSLVDLRRQGATIRARCHGSSGGPYRVSATFNGASIVASSCSCPVGSDLCKHVGALLLAWSRFPDRFTAVAEVDAALQSLSKEELIAILRQAIRRHPELEALLETPLPGVRRTKPVDAAVYRAQAEAVFAEAGEPGEADGELAEGLEAIIAVGEEFLEADDAEAAAAVAIGVLRSMLERHAEFSNYDDPVYDIVGRCVQVVEKSLKSEGLNGTAREPLLRVLFDVYLTDVGMGGTGLSDEAIDVLLEQATSDERTRIAAWLRSALATAKRGWASGALGGLLIELEKGTIDDESYLRLCRESGRTADLVDKLLELGRTGEATQVLRASQEHELVTLAERFVARGHGDAAEAVLAARAEGMTGARQDGRIYEWLRRRYASRNEGARELDMAVRMFRSYPTLEGFRDLRSRATQLRAWESIGGALVNELRAARRPDLLLRICLDEGDVDGALRIMDQDRVVGARMEVAAAAEASRPAIALKIYRQAAEEHIAYRTRPGYQEACKHLKKVQQMYAKLGEVDAWEQYIAGLRQKYHALRALREELAAAQL